ncbi:MAG: ubiquitin-like domain-containing protein [Chloroflexi bacterium]|nr:ubiquitin-like domain-containing protein [Chloroflexota bacterium]
MKPRLVLAFGAVLFLAAVGAYGLTFRSLRLEADGRTRTVLTHARTVALALRDAGIELDAEDVVEPAPESPVTRGLLIRVGRGRWIDVAAGHGPTPILAHEGQPAIPANLLLQAGVHLLPGDAVVADGRLVDARAPLAQLPWRLSLAPKHALLVVRDGIGEEHEAAGPTVGEALWQLGIPLHPADSVQPATTTPLADDVGTNVVTIVIRSAREFRLTVDGQTLTVRSAAPTVGEILAQAGFALTNLDYSQPAETASAPTDGMIHVVRVREEFIREQIPIAFGEQRQYLPELDLGTQQLMTPGVYGIQESTVRVRYEDGLETARTSEGERVAVPPVDRVMGYGTKVTIRSVSTPDGTFDYWHSITVYGSAYWPCGAAGEPGRCYYITASGKDMGLGIIAVTLSWYRVMQGWPVYVDRYGPAHIEDNGLNVRNEYWIDVAFPDYETFVALGGSGPKTTTLYFRTPVPSEDAIRFVAALPIR